MSAATAGRRRRLVAAGAVVVIATANIADRLASPAWASDVFALICAIAAALALALLCPAWHRSRARQAFAA